MPTMPLARPSTGVGDGETACPAKSGCDRGSSRLASAWPGTCEAPPGRRRHREVPEEEDLIRPQDASAGAPQRARQLVQLRRALLGLRCEEQEVFLLYQNGQMSYEEIAEATKVPLATVKMRMRLALGKLHEALDDGA